jgi:hypothetical protein
MVALRLVLLLEGASQWWLRQMVCNADLVAEDKDLLWLRRCGLLKAVNRRVLVSWL